MDPLHLADSLIAEASEGIGRNEPYLDVLREVAEQHIDSKKTKKNMIDHKYWVEKDICMSKY